MLIQTVILCTVVPALTACVDAQSSYAMKQSPSIADRPEAHGKDGDPGAIRVIVRGFRNDKGQLLASLFESAKGFPGDGAAARAREANAIEGDTVTVTFDGVPAGTYAVGVLHDEDKDFKMRTGTFGIPKEGYGVSNNAKGRFGPPKFSDAKFEVGAGTTVTLTIKLIYH